MAFDYNSSDTTSGADAMATQYNNLRQDVIEANRQTVSSAAGEAINASSKPLPVYIDPADDLLYIAEDSSTFLTMEVAGFVEDQNLSTSADVLITHQGRLSGFSSLSPGRNYFLAKSGSGESTYTDGVDSTGSTANVGTANDNAWARQWTPTNIAEVTHFKVKIYKTGTPVGTVYCDLVKTRNDSPPDGSNQQRYLIASTSVAVSSFSSGNQVSFEFSEPVRIGAGETVNFIIRHSESDSSNYLQIQSNTTASDCYIYSGGSWGAPSVDAAVEVTCTGGTFSAGDLTTYYFDYGKRIGRALTATEILMDLSPKLGLPIGKSKDTAYTAERDGVVNATGVGSGGSVPQFNLYVNGVIVAYAGDSTNSADARSTISYPISRGDSYMVLDDGTASPTVKYRPLL